MQDNNKKINGSPDQNQDKPQRKNSQARINANNKYSKTHYKDVSMKVKPETAEYLRNTAKKFETSLTQLVIIAVTEYDTNHSDTVTASDTEENTTSTTEDTAERIPEYIKNMIDRSKAYDKDFSEKQRAKRKAEREKAKAEYNLID